MTILGIDPGTLDKSIGKHGLAVYQDGKIPFAMTVSGSDDLEIFVTRQIEKYPITHVGMETCSKGGQWGNVEIRCRIHETIGFIKYLVRTYRIAVAEVAPHKTAQTFGREKVDRMQYCREHLGLTSCDEHMADASLVAKLVDMHEEHRVVRL